MSSGGNKAGFTLIEMLVALTIIVAILAMVYGSFAATTRSIDASGTRLADVERVCFALRLMTRQIRCAYAPNPLEPAASDPQQPDATGDLQIVGQTASVPPGGSTPLFRGNSRDPRDGILSFITSSGLGARPDAPRGLFRVTYLYDRFRSTLSISRQDRADTSLDHVNPSRSDLLLSNVTSVELKFHDGRQWQPTWDAAQRHALPRAVKVEIAVNDETGRTHLLGTTVPIMQEAHPESRNIKRAMAAGQP